MAAMVVICLGLGGWHLLWTKGQYVEAEPVVVGQPIKIHGRFFRFFAGDEQRRYHIVVEKPGRRMWITHGDADTAWWCLAIEVELHQIDEPGEYTLTLTPRGGSTIRGANFFVRAVDSPH
jgi:hypothetical protein